MLGKYIELFLIKNGMTQIDLAGTLNKSKASINHIIKGRKRIDTEISANLADIFNTTPEFWLDLQKKADNGTIKSPFEKLELFGEFLDLESPKLFTDQVGSHLNRDEIMQYMSTEGLTIDGFEDKYLSENHYNARLGFEKNGKFWPEVKKEILIAPATQKIFRTQECFKINANSIYGVYSGVYNKSNKGLIMGSGLISSEDNETLLEINAINTTSSAITIAANEPIASIYFKTIH